MSTFSRCFKNILSSSLVENYSINDRDESFFPQNGQNSERLREINEIISSRDFPYETMAITDFFTEEISIKLIGSDEIIKVSRYTRNDMSVWHKFYSSKTLRISIGDDILKMDSTNEEDVECFKLLDIILSRAEKIVNQKKELEEKSLKKKEQEKQNKISRNINSLLGITEW